MTSFQIILKDRHMKQSLEMWVSGRYRLNYIKRPVIEKEEDNSPVIYEKTMIIDQAKEENKTFKEKRTIGVQTLFRESEAQTDPAALGEIEDDGNFTELRDLNEFKYGNGLPVSMYEIELIEKARERRAFMDALPPLSDEACFNLRSRLMQEQEFREWMQKEKDYKDTNSLRLLKLQQFLEDREKQIEEKRLNKIGELKAKKDEIVEGNIGKLLKTRVKIIRSIKKSQNIFFKKDKFKRDIIIEYANFGSKVYGPLTRDGKNPDRNSLKLEIQSEYLTSYEGLCELETQISSSQLDHNVNIDDLRKDYKLFLRKQEKTHIKAIEGAFKSIENAEDKKKREERRKREEREKQEEEKKNAQVKPPEVVPEKISILEDIMLIQRLLRGRKEQNKMYEGKIKRAELIKELRSVEYWKSAGATEKEKDMYDAYLDKMTNGLIDAIQGQQISQTLDFLSKEMIRIRQEQKIAMIVNQAENERRRREAEEMGRRQAEEILRDRQDIMYKELLDVNQGTMDSYINTLISGTVNQVSKNQVMREIEIKANKLNKIVDKIENHFIKDDVTVRDLVSSFIFPEIERQKLENKIELEEKRFIETAKNTIKDGLASVRETIKKESGN